MTAATAIERELLESIGALPEQEGEQTEPNYEARLRRLGAHLYAKGAEAQDCLIALALHHLSRKDPKTKHLDLGLARLLATAARGFHQVSANAEELGQSLAKNDPPPEVDGE